VAESVVDLPKEVQVQEEDAEALRAMARFLQTESEALHEQRPVREPRQRVVERLESDDLLGPLRVADVAGDRRHPGELARLIQDRGNGYGDLERPSILVAPDRLVPDDSLAGANALENLLDLSGPLLRLENGDRLALHLRGRVAVHLGRAGVPAGDAAIGRRGDHGVVRGLEDRRHPVQRGFAPAPVADVHRHRADQPQPGLSLEGKPEHEPVAGAGGSREGLLELEHGSRCENHLVVAADPIGARGGEPLVVALAEQRVSVDGEDVRERAVVVDEAARLVLEELERRAVVPEELGRRLGGGQRRRRELPRRKNAARNRVVSVVPAVSPSGEPGLQGLSRHPAS
jgi:hypothetical protein